MRSCGAAGPSGYPSSPLTFFFFPCHPSMTILNQSAAPSPAADPHHHRMFARSGPNTRADVNYIKIQNMILGKVYSRNRERRKRAGLGCPARRREGPWNISGPGERDCGAQRDAMLGGRHACLVLAAIAFRWAILWGISPSRGRSTRLGLAAATGGAKDVLVVGAPLRSGAVGPLLPAGMARTGLGPCLDGAGAGSAVHRLFPNVFPRWRSWAAR